MKRIVFYFAVIILSVQVYSQKDMYFISACPDMQYRLKSFPSYLYKFDSDSLICIDTILQDKDCIIQFIKKYDFNKTIIIHYDNWKNIKENHIVYIDFSSNSIKIKTKEIIVPEIYTYSVMINYLDKDDLYCIGKKREGEKITLLGINFKFQISDISPIDFQQVELIGSVGGAIEPTDYLLLYTNEDNGELRIPKTKAPLKPLIRRVFFYRS